MTGLGSLRGWFFGMSTGGRGGKGGGELWELARLFTKLGFIAFGGPAAHIAMMRYEVLERSYARSCKRTSENSVKKLSEKGFERSSER
jgi:chromate transport protein ChrA